MQYLLYSPDCFSEMLLPQKDNVLRYYFIDRLQEIDPNKFSLEYLKSLPNADLLEEYLEHKNLQET